jgi:hypothetical protein
MDRMKRLQIFWLGFTMAMTASCIINTGGISGGSSGLIADPAAGLEKLTHYRADLTQTIKAKTSGGPVERTERFSMAVWRAQKAIFETIDTVNDAGETLKLAAGIVDQAEYFLPGAETGCRVYWNQENIQVNEFTLTGYLFPLRSGSAAGEETIGGIAARVYDVNTDSLGVKGVEASGKVWLAANGGYLLKYHLELSGSDALYGKGASGTMTLDYELSEVDSDAPVSYPGDCQPVLTDIPATDDAQNVHRQPGWLWYVSPSSPDQVQAFYKKYFSDQGWDESDITASSDGETEILFSQESTGRKATVSLLSGEEGTEVDVSTNDVKPPASTPSADATPAGEAPGARVMTSLSKLFGSAEKPGVLPSFAVVMDQEMPASSGQAVVTHTEAEVEGLNVHYRQTSSGKTTDALLFAGKEYEIVGGKAQPGSIGLRTDWILWQTDWLKVLMAAGLAEPKAEPGTTLEGREVEVFSVDGTDLPDMTGGILPVQITAMHGTIWVDHATGALLKADLQFEADVKKSGQTTATHDTGKFLLVVSRIGKVTVSLP